MDICLIIVIVYHLKQNIFGRQDDHALPCTLKIYLSNLPLYNLCVLNNSYDVPIEKSYSIGGINISNLEFSTTKFKSAYLLNHLFN